MPKAKPKIEVYDEGNPIDFDLVETLIEDLEVRFSARHHFDDKAVQDVKKDLRDLRNALFIKEE